MGYCNGTIETNRDAMKYVHGHVDLPPLCFFRDDDGKDYCVDCYKRRHQSWFGEEYQGFKPKKEPSIINSPML